MNKQLTELAKKVVEQKIAECESCNGRGYHEYENYHLPKGSAPAKVSCPKCADLRKLAGELVWHEWVDVVDGPELYPEKTMYKCACGRDRVINKGYH